MNSHVPSNDGAPQGERPLDRATLASMAVLGLLHAVILVWIRTRLGFPWDLFYLGYAVIGAIVVGAIVGALLVRWRLVVPLVTLGTILAVTATVTASWLATFGPSPPLAYTPLTLYVNFWPVVAGALTLLGAIEHHLRRWAGRTIAAVGL